MSDRPTPIKRARELRQRMTDAESLLWINLRNRKFHRLKFLRQHPIVYDMHNNRPLYFIADFYCAEKKLLIEVDGKIHDFQKEDDQHREEILNSLKLTVFRIKNEEVNNIRTVLEKICEKL
ncbi:MAG TPA: endonuclease domain-containing protein [Prolixibacteraceae bacterium]|nr:endonuclease domain-containing protein [Prolixibacteraceae bacterium]